MLDDSQKEPLDAEENVPAPQSLQNPPQVARTASNITSATPEPKDSFKRQKKLSPCDQVLVNIGQRLATTKEEDHYDAFGKNVAQKLRLLNNEQRIYAQKIINDALFEAELGGLTRFATVNPGILYSSSTTPSAASVTPSSGVHTYGKTPERLTTTTTPPNGLRSATAVRTDVNIFQQSTVHRSQF
ncbi:hypothetical protein J6590_067491 [Homalodisca vitripennis]|nr:hypothetical protein J6590_072229 [Homalodisca vitripennis]KAG8248331.1 hypothetical protein J6590_042951 [Homalodisca vitripennis]KAG8271213.1 hypothetical protein J6590_068103 [Homalodisca vitripennis]KAG8282100.1 hypothetical protein J6590_044841 [Homalodisca vitripennis]KAG8295257.1 hypothetical protein J6590_083828 [Homalodisca vitripennis]